LSQLEGSSSPPHGPYQLTVANRSVDCKAAKSAAQFDPVYGRFGHPACVEISGVPFRSREGRQRGRAHARVDLGCEFVLQHFCVCSDLVASVGDCCLPFLFAAEPMLLFDFVWLLMSSPGKLFGSQIARMASSLRPASAPQTPFCLLQPTHTNATYGPLEPSYVPQAVLSSFAPPSVADPPYAAGGGALLGVAVGVGGVLRGPNALAMLRGFGR